MTHTVQFHRVLRAPCERVYRAFIDPEALVKWLPPHGHTGRVFEIDVRVGGGYRMAFTQIESGLSHTFEACFEVLEPGRRIVHTDRFIDPPMDAQMTTTIVLSPVAWGTDLRIEQSGIPHEIPPEACVLGWQDSLSLLAALVELAPGV